MSDRPEDSKDINPVLRWASGLRLWLLCMFAIGSVTYLVSGKLIDAATYSTVITGTLYAFAGRDGVVQGIEKFRSGGRGDPDAKG
jgi:hypothetical protein